MRMIARLNIKLDKIGMFYQRGRLTQLHLQRKKNMSSPEQWCKGKSVSERMNGVLTNQRRCNLADIHNSKAFINVIKGHPAMNYILCAQRMAKSIHRGYESITLLNGVSTNQRRCNLADIHNSKAFINVIKGHPAMNYILCAQRMAKSIHRGYESITLLNGVLTNQRRCNLADIHNSKALINVIKGHPAMNYILCAQRMAKSIHRGYESITLLNGVLTNQRRCNLADIHNSKAFINVIKGHPAMNYILCAQRMAKSIHRGYESITLLNGVLTNQRRCNLADIHNSKALINVIKGHPAMNYILCAQRMAKSIHRGYESITLLNGVLTNERRCNLADIHNSKALINVIKGHPAMNYILCAQRMAKSIHRGYESITLLNGVLTNQRRCNLADIHNSKAFINVIKGHPAMNYILCAQRMAKKIHQDYESITLLNGVLTNQRRCNLADINNSKAFINVIKGHPAMNYILCAQRMAKSIHQDYESITLLNGVLTNQRRCNLADIHNSKAFINVIKGHQAMNYILCAKRMAKSIHQDYESITLLETTLMNFLTGTQL